jgi:hypothetical protein
MSKKGTIFIAACWVIFAVALGAVGFYLRCNSVRAGEKESGTRGTVWLVGFLDRVDLYDLNNGPLRVIPGDVVQIETRQWPVVPNYLGSKVKVKLTGDRVLDFIGQSGAPVGSFDPKHPKVGSSSWTVFFYVRESGETKVAISLEDEKGKRVDGYDACYIVKAKRRK